MRNVTLTPFFTMEDLTMRYEKAMVTRTMCWIALVAVFFIPAAANAEYISPTAVPYSSGDALDPESTYGAQVVIDGDLDTFCVLLDDSNPNSTPTTGHMIFDLGEVRLIGGANLISRNITGTPRRDFNPKDVDFFYFADDNPGNNILVDDIENDSDIVSILNHGYASLTGGESESVTWDSVSRRYIGMRINSSWEEGPDNWNYQFAEMEFEVVPEPTSLVLLGFGVMILVAFTWYRRRK